MPRRVDLSVHPDVVQDDEALRRAAAKHAKLPLADVVDRSETNRDRIRLIDAEVLACLAWLASCSADQGTKVQTLGFVEIESPDGYPLCTNTADAIESGAWRIAEDLRIDEPDAVSIRLGSIDDVHERCGEMSAGCAYRRDGVVHTEATLPAVLHELVHALRFQQTGTYTTRFFEEGLAEVVSSGELSASEVSVSDAPRDPDEIIAAVDLEVEEVPYLLATHFVAWLRIRYGGDRVADFYTAPFSMPSDIPARFAARLGVTIEDASAAWATEAPSNIALQDRCDLSIPLAWDADEITLELDLSCGADGRGPWPTLDGGYSVSTTACFVLDREADVHIQLAADSDGLQTRLALADCTGTASAEAYTPAMLEGSVDLTRPFAPCVWQVSFSDDIDAAGPVSLILRR